MDSLSSKISVFIILLIFIEGAIFGIDSFRAPKYQSKAKYMVVIQEDKADSNMNAYSTSIAANHLAELTAEIVDTAHFIKNVYKRSGIIYNAKDIDEYRELIGAKVVKETEIVEVSMINKVSQRAQKVCQAIIDEIQNEVSGAKWSTRDFTIEIIDPPSLPQEPISPKLFRDLAIGFIGVLIVTVSYFLVKS